MASNSSALVVPPSSTRLKTVEAKDIREVRSPVKIPGGWEWLWWTLGIAAVAAAAYAGYRRWKKNRKEAKVPEVIVPPDWRARMRLKEALEFLHEPKQFCILASDAIRCYLEERFDLHAPDRTTEEFLEEIQESAHLSFEQKGILADFLGRCDLVKFAKYEPERAELQGIHDVALRLIDETAGMQVQSAECKVQNEELNHG